MSRVTSRELVYKYLTWQDRERGRTPITLNRYGYTMTQWLDHLDGRHVLDAGLDDLREFVLSPVKRATRHSRVGDEPSPATKKRKVAELRSFYKWLAAEGYRHDDPSLRLTAPAVHNENPRPIPHAMWAQFWQGNLTDVERVAFGLAYFGGLRRHEIVALGPHHLDAGRLVNFRRKGGSRKTLPLRSCTLLVADRDPRLVGGDPESFLGPLERVAHQRRNEALLLPWRPGRNGAIDGSAVNKRLRRVLVREGMDELAFSPHQARHSFCTNMLDMGVPLLDVSRLAGHSSVTVTQRYLASSDDPISGLIG